ncbi:helix-turn-helix transcriptional regulator [Actinomadura graeca]|uniref:Helix-turn-helix transcriptional regulator n=1 Tax=Actinomadura graeca TaxID=2750812 RepID=A0ABX8R2A4_9ACTN|nr:helix-turn-helix transcriptional regulator [Actinomadura graeca]QXJ25216.1 helix-turn-helix transcriptional regulator [Actinomadura graeca]
MTLKRRRLALRRRSVGYSQEQLADRLGAERSTVGRWERAETDPMPWIRPKLAKELKISLDELDELLRNVEADPRDRSIQGHTEAGTVTFICNPDFWDDDVKRRELLQDTTTLTVGAAAAPVLAALSQGWRDSEPSLPGASVSRGMIDDWENVYDVHVASYVHDPPLVVLEALAADWADIAPHLRRNQPPDVDLALAHAAARHAFLIAGGLVEIGDRRHSRRWWDKARSLADKSEDQSLASYSRSWEVTTRLSDDREDPARLIPLVQEARRLAGTRPTHSLIYAVAVEAEAHAAAGDLRAATAAIRDVETLFPKLPTTGRQWGEDRLRYVQSQIYAWAGDAKRAGEAQDAARPLFRSGQHQTVQLKLHVPVIHARNDPEQALAQALGIIDALPEERRVARIRSNARRVISVLPEKARTLPAARDLQALTSGI